MSYNEDNLIDEINHESEKLYEDDTLNLSMKSSTKSRFKKITKINNKSIGVYIFSVSMIFTIILYCFKDVSKFPNILKQKKENPEEPDKLNWVAVLILSILLGLIPTGIFNLYN